MTTQTVICHHLQDLDETKAANKALSAEVAALSADKAHLQQQCASRSAHAMTLISENKRLLEQVRTGASSILLCCLEAYHVRILQSPFKPILKAAPASVRDVPMPMLVPDREVLSNITLSMRHIRHTSRCHVFTSPLAVSGKHTVPYCSSVEASVRHPLHSSKQNHA